MRPWLGRFGRAVGAGDWPSCSIPGTRADGPRAEMGSWVMGRVEGVLGWALGSGICLQSWS